MCDLVKQGLDFEQKIILYTERDGRFIFLGVVDPTKFTNKDFSKRLKLNLNVMAQWSMQAEKLSWEVIPGSNVLGSVAIRYSGD